MKKKKKMKRNIGRGKWRGRWRGKRIGRWRGRRRRRMSSAQTLNLSNRWKLLLSTKYIWNVQICWKKNRTKEYESVWIRSANIRQQSPWDKLWTQTFLPLWTSGNRSLTERISAYETFVDYMGFGVSFHPTTRKYAKMFLCRIIIKTI